MAFHSNEQDISLNEFSRIIQHVIGESVIQTLFISLTVLLALVTVGLSLQLYRTKKTFYDYRCWAENEIDRVSQTDSLTGALKKEPFFVFLSNECRRAIRDFTPLTLMMVEIKKLDGSELSSDTFHQIVNSLRARLCRPGDQLGYTGGQQLCFLLPSTNENAGVFVNLCHQTLLESFEPSLYQFTLVACTYQPSSNLSAEKAFASINQILVKALNDIPGGVLYQAEPCKDFNPMYF